MNKSQVILIALQLASRVKEVSHICLHYPGAQAVDVANKIIIEVNTSIPSYRKLHDVCKDMKPPARRPVLINRVDDRCVGKAVWEIFASGMRGWRRGIIESRASTSYYLCCLPSFQ